MIGVGRAGGAGTIVNAIATGKGAAFGLAFEVEARVADAKAWHVSSDGRPLDARSSRLAVASARQVCQALGEKKPHDIAIRSDIPPERGLKSSSAVSVAVIQATLAAHSRRWPDTRILKAAAQAGLASGTSITGAYDDAAACLLGGTVVTDNRAFRIVRRGEIPRGLQALVHAGDATLKTSAVRGVDFSKVRGLVGEAWASARAGRYDRAMIINSAAYAAALGHTTTFSFAALREGAWAAGLSGKGPGEIALASADVLDRLHGLFPKTIRVPLRRKAVP